MMPMLGFSPRKSISLRAAGDDVEELVGAAHLHVGAQAVGVVALHQRVERLVQVDGVAVLPALAEVLAGQELLQGEVRGQPDQLGEVELREPVGVVRDRACRAVEDLEGLLGVGLGVVRPSLRASAAGAACPCRTGRRSAR